MKTILTRVGIFSSFLFVAVFGLVSMNEARAAINLPVNTLFTVHRTNYKTEKTLIYQSLLQKGACRLDAQLLSAYYVVDMGGGKQANEVMSADSEKYFGPDVDEATVTDSSFDYTFEALKQATSIPEADRKIMVDLVDRGGVCEAFATIRLSGVVYRLKNIDIELSKVLGIPTGVSWVRLDLENLTTGNAARSCVVGKCPAK